MTQHWYALRVKPHKETAVYQLLQAREVDTYYPTLKVKPKNPRAARERPYFPGYLFVRANLEEVGVNAFSWLPGTSGLVAFGEIPAVVPDHLVQELKRRLAQLKVEAESVLDYLRKGDRVRIVSGPFQGYEAIFDSRAPGKERVQVLLAFLSSHPHPVKLDAADIVRLK
jgi:transcription elongation factor/antiterminator RfaH